MTQEMNRAVRLIAVDLDGTLLDSKQRISARNLAALRSAMEKGIRVAVATGRMYCSALQFWEETQSNAPLMAYNGAYIRDPKTDQEIFHCPLPFDIVCEAAAIAQGLGGAPQFYKNDTLYALRRNPYTDHYSEIYSVPYFVVPGLDFFRDGGSTKVLILAEPDRLPSIAADLSSRLGPRVAVAMSESSHVEITLAEATKGTGLQKLAAHFDIPLAETAAIGDAENDAGMIREAGIGIVVRDADEKVKAIADFVTEPSHDSGVASALARMGLVTEEELARAS